MVDIAAGADAEGDHGVSLREAVATWTRVALSSFGGPAGQIAVMHRILVEEKKWVSETRFLHALNYCMLLPGPEAQQLATYIGWLMHGTIGGLIAGGLFVLPGVVAIMALSVVYAAFGNVGAVSGLFFGLKAAVLAIVLQALLRLGARALNNSALQAIAAGAFGAMFFFDVPFPLVIVIVGVVGYLGGRAGRASFASANAGALAGAKLKEHAHERAAVSIRRSLRVAALWASIWLAPVALLFLTLGAEHLFTQIAAFFSKMAVVTFGGAYAALAYVAQQAVDGFHWLKPGEMLDGLGMAETTPGPLIMVLQFVGFMAAYRNPGALAPMLAGALGGLLATWVTFAPCFLWIFLGAPYIERLRGNRALNGALSAITAAVVGVILDLALWFFIHTIFRQTYAVRALGLDLDAPVLASVDIFALALSAAAALALFRFRAGLALILVGCSAAGIALSLAGGLRLAGHA